MRSCTHALALNDISLIFFWRVRHPRKHEIKKASFLGGGGDRFKKKASNENVTSAAHRIVETPDLSTKLKKKTFEIQKFEISSSKSLKATVIMMKHEIR